MAGFWWFFGLLTARKFLTTSASFQRSTWKSEKELIKQSIFCHPQQQEPAYIMSDSIISELEFLGFPRKRESVSGSSSAGGWHQSRIETQPVAVVPGATFSRTTGTCRGTGFFPRQRQHVGSLPAAAGHRWGWEKIFHFWKDSTFFQAWCCFLRSYVKSQSDCHLIMLLLTL